MTTETMPSPETSLDDIDFRVQADIDDLHFRDPIVDHSDPDTRNVPDYLLRRNGLREYARADSKRYRGIDRRWTVITEAARRAIIDSPEVRELAASFTARPLNEELPLEAVSELADSNPSIAQLASRGRALMDLLGLSPVPDELLETDLWKSPTLLRKENAVRTLRHWKSSDNPERYGESLEYIRSRVENSPGITLDEGFLVARRYRYARDIKMLGLMAELQDQPIGSTEPSDGFLTHELESGTRLVMTSEAFESNPNLLDPKNWERRRQLKDRVYVVTVEGKDYIMKERKTSRHTDVKGYGHKDGLTSQQEFEVAKEFSDLGVIGQEDIKLHWEKPLGYVEFPDGYQFCLFEKEPDLDSRLPAYQLAREIMAVPERYTEEFEETRKRAREIYDSRRDLLWAYDQIGVPNEQPKRFAISRAARRHNREYEHQRNLSFQEFARIKARTLVDGAQELLSRTMWGQGYINSDVDGFAFRIGQGEERPTIEIIGFDFEYYRKHPEGASKEEQYLQDSKNTGLIFNNMIPNEVGERAIAVAAYYSMLKEKGHQLPQPRG
jgi:hypothetical protein